MKKIGMLKTIKLCKQYDNLDSSGRLAIQQERLQEIIRYAREHSPYYKELYKNLPKNFTLSDLPTVSKAALMEQFDEWVTNPSIKLSDINTFMDDLDNIGRKFQKDYLIFTTSGSTGNPLVAVYDQSAANVMGGINAARSFARKSDLTQYIKCGGKTIGIFATGGFYLGNSSVRSRLLKMPWKKKQMDVTSALLPVSEIVEKLNTFRPAMLGGYPSNLELLIEEQKSGRLHIQPVLIMTGGEHLSDSLRERLAAAFDCYVQTSYSCTEGGSVACECTQKHFHINTDWVIVEAVDRDNRPVADGEQSDKILLTNLFNFTQPFIRYEITDRVVMHHEPCLCGNPSPWLTLEGRSDDILTFLQNGTIVKIPPLAVYALLKEIHELKRFQLISHADNHLELRFLTSEDTDRIAAFEKAALALRTFLLTHQVIDVSISMSDEVPKQHPKSGKFKHIIALK